MALQVARGVIQWLAADAVGTDYVVSGLAFQPEAIVFSWVGIQSAVDAETQTTHQRRGRGFAVSPTSRRAVATFAEDAAATSNCGAIARDDCPVCTVDGAGAGDGELDLESIQSDGFTMTVDDQAPANITVMWTAFAGLSVAALVDIAEPAATGNVDYTVTGFDNNAAGDQVVLFAGCQSTAALNTGAGTDSGFCIGFATGASGEQAVICGNSDDASAAMDTDKYNQGGECLAMIVLAGGNPNARAALTQFATNNFRLNWIARGTTNRRYIALAMKGGLWRAGEFTIDMSTTNATATVSGLPFAPIGFEVITCAGAAEAAAGTSSGNDHISWGSAVSTSDRGSFGHIDSNATASSAAEIGLSIEYDEILIGHSVTTAAVSIRVDVNAFNSDGFQAIVDTSSAGASASSWVGYLAYGNPPPASPTAYRMLSVPKLAMVALGLMDIEDGVRLKDERFFYGREQVAPPAQVPQPYWIGLKAKLPEEATDPERRGDHTRLHRYRVGYQTVGQPWALLYQRRHQPLFADEALHHRAPNPLPFRGAAPVVVGQPWYLWKPARPDLSVEPDAVRTNYSFDFFFGSEASVVPPVLGTEWIIRARRRRGR